MTKKILFFSILLVLGLGVLQWLKHQFIATVLSFEIYVGIIALLFLILGFFLSPNRIRKTKNEDKEFVDPSTYSISGREMEVLKYMAEGMSNNEIALKMFVSLPTVKTHCYNLYKKLDVKRRTQAIAKAKVLDLL